LTGEVEGRQTLFLLREGANVLGRGQKCDVVVSSPGVSDRHAVIEVGAEAIGVRDLASKNGTFLGKERISSGSVEVGEEILFGPVALRVEEVDPEDTFLSVTARRSEDEGTTGLTDSSTATVAWSGAGSAQRSHRWLLLLDEVTNELVSGASSPLGRALATLSLGLELSGAALLRMPPEGSPILLASYGDLLGDLPVEAIAECRAAAREGGGAQILECRGSERLSIFANGDWDSPALLLAGRLSRDDIARKFLQTTLRILSQFVGGPAEKAETKNSGSRGLHFPKGYVPGDSPGMKAVYRQVGSVAVSDLPVLIVGETGVGKECLAETIHLSSDRRAGPFVPINCAAIPAELLEAELFGIAKGVATGVVERSGRFALAGGGTLFLDEIGDMSAALQAKLLRALEERIVQPVGGVAENIDVRLVAATNTDLVRKVETGEFRRDLYYRLAGLVVAIPALRRRMEDLGGLVEFFFHQACDESGRDVLGLTYGAMRQLRERLWPGNVRELRHAVRRLVFLCSSGQAIDSGMVMGLEEGVFPGFGVAGEEPGADFSTWERLDIADTCRGLVREAMRRSNGNQTHAAALLGVTRSSLRRRLVKYSLSFEEDSSE
jgi:DNA-binding NtrC family response regulator/pSer/pThr/pTyr-binding forkhead associated (FHA) protein